MQRTVSSSTEPDWQMIAVVHIGFVVTGVVTVLLGPVLPVLQAKWALDDAQAGYLFTAQFTGSITPLAAMRTLIERLGLLRLLSCGYGLMAVGVAGLAAGSWAVGIASVFCYGIGLGLVIPGTNLLISEMNSARRASALSIVNFTWGIGAVLCAPVFGLFAESGNATTGLMGLSLTLALILLLMLRFWSFTVGSKTSERAETKRGFVRNPFVALIGALIFLYVGSENAVAGWVGTHAMRMGGSAYSNWKLVPSVFWAALLTGRAVAPIALRRLVEEKLALVGLLTGLCGTLLLLLAGSLAGLIAGVALAGLGFASIYPIIVALLPRAFGSDVPRVAGLIFLLAGLGGATMTWAVGFLSVWSGSLRIGLLVPFIGNLLMIGLQLAIIIGLDKRAKSDVETQSA